LMRAGPAGRPVRPVQRGPSPASRPAGPFSSRYMARMEGAGLPMLANRMKRRKDSTPNWISGVRLNSPGLLRSSAFLIRTAGRTSTPKVRSLPAERRRGGWRIGNGVSRQARAAGGTGVQISFDLSMGADVTPEIRSGGGQVIRRLSASRAATAGTNQLLWDDR